MLRTNPLAMFGMWRQGLALMRTGRLSLKRERIKDVAQLQRALPGSKEVV
jgi:hypothetical protein